MNYVITLRINNEGIWQKKKKTKKSLKNQTGWLANWLIDDKTVRRGDLIM